ncbi:unnamed protein product [Rhizoctonia solani]|uniref:FAD-binding FR-type domain-containing protein n=1 Tax=Rhizoctonia solani TaxID=456999 RepID=A0A8H3CMP4_9AGAM|nr:unnamed protein product [Rhizoctonia solani]
MTTPIPQPPSLPFIGNVRDIDTELPTQSFALLAKQYGEIYRLNIVAHHGESNWGIAHRILMPAFGPLSIRGVFDDMLDVVSQLVLKWERFGPSHEIDPTDDFTRMAFEMIALCTFNYRLNTFYTENEPPFVKPMGDFLKESFLRIRRPRILQTLLYGSNAKYAADMEIMNTLAERIIEDRKNNPSSKKDLLNAMLLSKDPQTGQGLSEENIKAQMLTFLIVGHEATLGMSSFAMAHIMKNPEVYAKIRHEVDQVLGKEPIKFENLSKLSYINALLRETLRATPVLPQITVTSYEDEVENFDPERMLDGNFEAMPPKAWLPFGSGGRMFAWQEALIALATIFQKFDFTPADPLYSLQIKQILTVKPNNFKFLFGAGNHDWAQTYQRIPKLIDSLLEKKGAKRLLMRGEGDASRESFMRSFDQWEEQLWNALAKSYEIDLQNQSRTPEVKVRLLGAPSNRVATLRYTGSGLGQVIENKLLTTFGAPAKHHIEIELPADVTYRAGDYLSILPLNPPEYVRRCFVHFNLSPEQQHMRSDLETLLTDYDLVESAPPTNSMLDLIEKYRDIDLPLGIFIASLPTMRLRQYSISSSPLWNPSHVTLTFGVVAQGKFLGVASNYLAGLRRGDRVQVLVRPSSKAFHPPIDPGVPMMMFAAGSGIAPFRGFMQERAIQKKAGRDVAKSVLFFGCRNPEEDYLYADELAEWQTLGVVDVRPAFSRGSEDSGGKQYVQNRVWSDRELVRSYDKQNAKVDKANPWNIFRA